MFINQFDLSTNAYGSTANFLEARAMAIGENGHVLWWGHDLDGKYSVWLSTPVPEPAMCLPIGTGLMALIRFRHRRAPTW